MTRARHVALAALLLCSACGLASLGGCGAKESRLNPDEPLDGLPAAATAQLCRYTIDVLLEADFSCAPAPPGALMDVDACQAAPPWVGYETVLDWEECVNARTEDACLAEAPCVP